MATWKNIVVETENLGIATGDIAQNVNTARGFSDVLSLDHGGFTRGDNGAFDNSHGIWSTDADALNLTPFLINRDGVFPSTPTNYDSASAGVSPIGNFPFDRNQVYMLAPVPELPNGLYPWPYNETALIENLKPYYWYEYGGLSGPLSVEEITSNTIPISPIAEGNISTDVTVPDAVVFTALEADGATWHVNGSLDLTDSGIGDAETFASLADWTDNDTDNEVVSNEDTIVFNSGGTIDDLEANSDAHFSSGFRIYNVDTKSIVQNLNMGYFFYVSGDDVTIANVTLDIEDLTEGGWTLTWSKTNDSGGFTNYELSRDDIDISQSSNGSVTLTRTANTPTTEWNHISSFASWNAPGNDNEAFDIKLTAINKKSIQFGMTCDTSGNAIFERAVIYPAFHSMCGAVNLDTTNNVLQGEAYAVSESIILTNSGSETEDDKSFTGSFAVVNEKPQIRLDVNF